MNCFRRLHRNFVYLSTQIKSTRDTSASIEQLKTHRSAKEKTIDVIFMTAMLSGVLRAQAADLTDLSTRAARTTVYISATYNDKAKHPKTSTGTGFLITPEGDILTAYHVIQDWLQGTDAEKNASPLSVRIGSKFSTSHVAVFENGDPKDDFAVIRLQEGGSDFPYAPICYNPGVQAGSFIFAFGYPYDKEFAPIPGTFNNTNGDGNRWSATLPIAPGMSGGPVYNETGFVIALVNAGIDTPSGLLTPLRWAKSTIENRTTARPACFRTCRTPENGVESWGLTSPWSENTEWLSGGHGQAEACGTLQQKYLAGHPGQALDVIQTSESSQKDFLGHVTYQYHCSGIVKINPIYQLKNSPACGLDQ